MFLTPRYFPLQLEDFVVNTLSTIQPELVMCGGDLTEAKSSLLKAAQDEAEWQQYRDIVSKRWRNVAWLDIRGNHDNLNVLSRNSSENFYAKYSSMGPRGFLNSYKVSLASRGQKFNIIAVDATWAVGMNYPFNFVGYIDRTEQSSLDGLVSSLKNDEVSIMFGHYPTSVVAQFDYIRTLISRGLVYLSGHLHDLALFRMYQMYSFHDKDNLELELVDWKNNRKFRILAVDNGKLSFTDVKFDDWPIALVTYPKDTKFMMPSKENYSHYEENTIKVLVFHKINISKVIIGIDMETEVEASAVDGGPLYVLPWDAGKFKKGAHRINVKVVDENRIVKEFQQDFTLNPREADKFSNVMSNFVLRSSFSKLFHWLYGLTLFFNLAIPSAMAVTIYLSQSGKLSSTTRRHIQKFSNCCLVRKLMLVTGHNVICVSLIIFVIYMAVGPWVVGSLVEGRTGAVFAWGVVVDSTLVHSQVPFAYYFVHFGLIHPVVVLAIGHLLDFKYGQMMDVGGGAANCGIMRHVAISVSLLLMMAFSVFLSLSFWHQFGSLGFLLGPLKTWSYVFYSAMFWLAWRSSADRMAAVHRVLTKEKEKNEDEDVSTSADKLL